MHNVAIILFYIWSFSNVIIYISAVDIHRIIQLKSSLLVWHYALRMVRYFVTFWVQLIVQSCEFNYTSTFLDLYLVDCKWNPGISNKFATCLTNGCISVYAFDDDWKNVQQIWCINPNPTATASMTRYFNID